MKNIISIIGAGFVGTTFALVLSHVGYKVFLIDVDEEKIESLKSGKAHFYEPGVNELLNKTLNKTLFPTTKYSEGLNESHFIFSCVGTPELPDGSTDMKYVFDVANKINVLAKSKIIFVQKSTVPIGTGDKIEQIFSNKKITYISNPEFLRESSAIFDTIYPSRTVIGSNKKYGTDELKKIYLNIFKTRDKFDKIDLKKNIDQYSTPTQKDFDKFHIVSTKAAELIKTTSNAFLATKISFTNLIAKLSDKNNINSKDVLDGVGMDNRISRAFLHPGLGWGGSCLPKDIKGLSSIILKNNLDPTLLDAVIKTNESMVDYAINLLENELTTLIDKKITVLGLSFKPGTSDIRNSQSLILAKNLSRLGSEVFAYDPKASKKEVLKVAKKIIFTDDKNQLFRDTDAIVIGTEWSEFRDLDWKKIIQNVRNKYILDTRNLLVRKNLEKIGFHYNGIGS